MFGSASASPFGLRSSRTEHPQHQRPRGWARTNRRSGPSQVAKLIWAIYEPELLSARVRHILEDPSNEFTLSYAAVWELLNKVGRGRLLVAGTSVADVFEDIKGFGVSFLPITMDHILSAASLPHIHSDPFDRILSPRPWPRECRW